MFFIETDGVVLYARHRSRLGAFDTPPTEVTFYHGNDPFTVIKNYLVFEPQQPVTLSLGK
jgi:hypothetical protein